MGRTIRVIGVVACLFTLWLVTTGVNGCMVEPDASARITVQPHSSLSPTQAAEFFNAEVYTANKKLDGNLGSTGTNTYTLQWYTALEGQTLTGLVTVIDANGQKHTHKEYTVTPQAAADPPVDVECKAMR